MRLKNESNNSISDMDKSMSKKVVTDAKNVARLKAKDPPKTSSYNDYSYSEETDKNGLSSCWSNPGGATICTQSNAQNTMVYNESSGMYEPGY